MKPETILTWQIRFFGLIKIPLIFFCFPKVISITNNRIEIRIKLNYRTRNHLKSMYFGVLSVGADLTAGFLAMKIIKRNGYKIDLIFKDFHADFLRRAEGDVHFICEEGKAIQDLVALTEEIGERKNLPVKILAIVPSISTEPVAEFILTLSLKKR
mgnify:CR=1 FL=1